MAKSYFASWFWRAKHFASGFWAGAGIVPTKPGVEFVIPRSRTEFVIPDGNLTEFVVPRQRTDFVIPEDN